MVRTRYLPILAVFVLGATLAVSTASAHVLKTDGTIGATLHIEPNDNPGTNATSTISLFFQSSETPLDVSKCACMYRITQASSTLLSLTTSDPRLAATPQHAAFDFRFPAIGSYTLTVEGPSFKLAYDVEVATPEGSADEDHVGHTLVGHSLHIILFGGAILFGLYLIVSDKLEKRSSNVST